MRFAESFGSLRTIFAIWKYRTSFFLGCENFAGRSGMRIVYPFVSTCILFFFFFQAEDGIRDLIVTGVQTCALPIYDRGRRLGRETRGHDELCDRGAGTGARAGDLHPLGAAASRAAGRPDGRAGGDRKSVV